MKIFKLIPLLLLIIFLPSCNKNNKEVYKKNGDKGVKKSQLEFYLLKHVKGKHQFKKQDKPIFTGEDIESYNWKSHKITFKTEFIKKNSKNMENYDPKMGGSKLLGIYYPDQFAIYLNGKEIYKGYLEPQNYISFAPTGAMVVNSDSDSGIKIVFIGKDKDVRDCKVLKDFLRDVGLFE